MNFQREDVTYLEAWEHYSIIKPFFLSFELGSMSNPLYVSPFPDLVVLTADLPTLLGVITGIAILTGLICFVLKLFSSNRYPHPRHYANANLAPPLLFSSDNQWINGNSRLKTINFSWLYYFI